MILIYTEHISPRLLWIVDVLFAQMNGIEVSLTSDLDQFKLSDGVKLNYSETDIEGISKIRPHTLLFEKNIREHDITFSNDGINKLYLNTGDLLGFDLFSAAFYLLSRYEEYLPHDKDKHGRYRFNNSLAFKHGFIETPLVDFWMNDLFAAIANIYANFSAPKRKFRLLPTMDVDVAYAYRGRSFARNFRSIAKDVLTLNLDRIKDRRKTKSTGLDPFDTFDYFNRLTKEFDLDKKHFFLLGDYGKHDKNLHHHDPDLTTLIKSHSETAGSHPSYAVHTSEVQLEKEKRRLEKIIGRTVNHSRYHYLKFELPESFRQLCRLGYTEDYSMAYAEQPGFRTSTSIPYTFYDLSTESPTELIIYTTAVMDGTCENYLKLSPDEAVKKINSLVDTVRKVDGTFILLWHNESLSNRGNWKGWRDVFHRVIKYAALKV
ncbi:MAG: hypothetical protein ACI8YO_001362 [Gammaproteobacteria bacterium]